MIRTIFKSVELPRTASYGIFQSHNLRVLSFANITPLILLVVVVVISAAQSLSAGSFQIAPPDSTAKLDQTSEPKGTNEQVDRGQGVHDKRPSKTLIGTINGKTEDNTGNESNESERLDPDRPHLPEASTTVGRGRMILEGGYTFNERKSSSFSAHDAPEALFRAGVLAEWFELRIGQNFLKQEQAISGVTSKAAGIQDLYVRHGHLGN